MKIIALNINKVRSIEAANFVSRQPPYQWEEDQLFSPSHHFIYFHLDGLRTIGLGNDCYNVKPGDMIFFFAHRKHYAPKPKGNYQAMNVSFTVDPEDALLPEYDMNEKKSARLQLPFKYSAKINSSSHFLFEEIVYSFLSSSPFKNRKSPFLLSQLLLEIAEISVHTYSRIPTSIDTVISLLERNPGENWSIDELAGKANMSRATLTRKFRKATGKSILQLQLDIKLKHALSIIHNNSDIKIKEIAEMLNFYDEYHFSKTFKRKFGMSPLHYKKSRSE